MIHEGIKGAGFGRSDPPLYFRHLVFGTYNELPLYFQLSVNTWFLTGFYGNHSYMNDITNGRNLGYLSFRVLFKFELNTKSGEKTAFRD